MYFIDTHTHIYLVEFEEDCSLVMERAKAANVEVMLMPAIDSTTHEAMMRHEKNYQGCFSMIGLHPCSVNKDFEKELAIIIAYLQKRKFIAIGEIGLDFYWDKTYTDEQYKAFHRQIEIALQYSLPVSIHSRNATDECIEVIKQYKNLRGVFHCFSGSYEQALKIIETNFLLGIGGVVTFKNSGLDKVIEKTGLRNVILETDAPYLAPVPYRGKRNEPAYTAIVAEKLSSICNCAIEDVGKITTENAKNLFKLR